MRPSSPSAATMSYGKPVLAVELLGDGRDPLLRELAHRLPQQLVVVRKVEVH
jgi:hypothetical protein